MKGRDLRLLPVALCAWASALLCVFMPHLSATVMLVALGSAVVAGRAEWIRRRTRRGTARVWQRRLRAAAGMVVVCLAAVAGPALTVLIVSPERAQVAALEGATVDVVVEVLSNPSPGSDGRLWADAHAVAAARPGHGIQETSAPVRLGIAADAVEGGLAPGTQIRLRAEAKRAGPGERAVVVLFGQGSAVVADRGGFIPEQADRVRMALIERALRLPAPGAALLPGLAVGDTRAVDEKLNDAMLASGLSHLTAVSGSNCAIVTAAAFGVVALLGGGRTLRIIVAAVSLAGFVVLVTPEPSVIRAAAMAGVAMLSLLLGRPRAGFAVLLLAVTVLLIADPWLASTAGFALSAVATGALIILAPPVAHGLSRWMPYPLALVLAVPLAAQLACGPIIALFADHQSLIGVVANLLAAPAAPIATVIGLLSCVTMFLPWLADLLAATAWLPSAWIATTAQVTAELPLATVAVSAGVLPAVGIALLSAALGWLLIRSPEAYPRWLRAAALLIVAVATAGVTGGALVRGPLAPLSRPSDWSIAACDIGQGDAVIVRSAGQIALIDTGPDPATLRTCLESLGITRVDLLVLTHFDLDHGGGMEALRGRVDTVLHGPPTGSSDTRALENLRDAGATLHEAARGQTGQLGDASWRVLWPRAPEPVFPAGNDASVVWEISGGGVPRMLLLGDLSGEAQRLMQRVSAVRGPYVIVKVAHHGSADQDADLYAEAAARLAIFTVGADNSYGHPREQTLSMLEATGAVIARTDLQGQILISQTDEGLSIWTERELAPSSE
ncbi:competence protein ComEC [Microbacterium keratanolyticum]|uniref:Competence protein ComEC n=1 Tax=Microbacterium keratanolyticum TaxID=67574 RepID=A0A9W6HTR4_9MICO|nr:ComEC/Rec2 family competence protein [Microbacterium keratanolyticum]MBM7470188.1 competence protein ComEC [Microbacterium keratanolyticum]GLK02267.1 competence protein ComEC [Microbacterium keratanolyticum]